MNSWLLNRSSRSAGGFGAGPTENRHRHSPPAIDSDSRPTVAVEAGSCVNAATSASINLARHRGNVLRRERAGRIYDAGEFFHAVSRRPCVTSTTVHRPSDRRPQTAAAATIAGDMMCGRRRPSGGESSDWWSRRSSPLATRSPLIPTHIEQPESAHSIPASRPTIPYYLKCYPG